MSRFTPTFVTDVSTVREFVEKYYKPIRLTDAYSGWKGFKDILIASHEADYSKYGYDLIDRHSSVTGDAVYFGKKSEEIGG